MPSSYGYWFSVLLLLLYLLGTNYQNNLILLLCFILSSIFLLAMVLAFRNLYGLQLELSNDGEAYSGRAGQLPLQLSTKEARQRLTLTLLQQAVALELDWLDRNSQVKIPYQFAHRGCYDLPRLRVSSDFPFGLFQCWSYPGLAGKLWVYPEPAVHQQRHYGDEHSGQQQLQLQPDEIKPYQAGDSQRQLLFKRLARDPANPVSRAALPQGNHEQCWVQVPALSGAALEQALMEASSQLHELDKQAIGYGLICPAGRIELGSGQRQLQRCLQALALC
ncbi:hypothetical protein [Arsukibacterium sp.]|uniref:hypothetical protein n=1 Tax=Arsukibacterium sp. TaxID=1977258 RepID=UPI002FD95036